ncbi:MAG: DEAD/DEAH box helicase [Spirochaetales bacterium]|jgi:ATP-dependent RNA helicase RhlB|nr:DEAD/DEAH box helicase [Spirochaetales bacterium]
MKFTELNLDERLLKAAEEAGFIECFPVQEETFKRTLTGLDVTVQSQTGSGKTAAFLITIFHQLTTGEKYKGKKALVIVPTRELATQIEEDARKLGKYLPFKIGSFFGGIGYGVQEALLREGVDLMIGTPGRLIDFSHQKKINLLDVGILVIDEADRLFDMGFLPDLRKLLRKMPPAQERLTMLLSATLGLRVSSLAWEYMNGAEEIEIDPEQVTVETITQQLYHVSSAEKMRLFLGILKKVNPSNAIIFTNTKHAAEEISKRMELNGYRSQFIIGDLPQKKRLRIIDDMKEGRLSFLVATDVAARGLHVDDLDLVVNYDVPEDAENYVHRIGRTARVGKSGLAVTLACEKYVFGLEAIEKYIGQKIPVLSFTEEDFSEDKSAGMRIYTERYGRGRDEREGGRRTERRGRGARDEPRREGGRRRPYAAGEDFRGRQQAAEGAPVGNAEDSPRREEFRPNRGRGPRRADETQRTAPADGQQAKRVSGPGKKMNKEERLAFYREKYGENFEGASAGTRPASGERKHSRRERGGKHGRQDTPRRDRQKPGAPGQPAFGGPAAQQSRPDHKPQPPAAEAQGQNADAQKPGLLGKILGFFKGKKE